MGASPTTTHISTLPNTPVRYQSSQIPPQAGQTQGSTEASSSTRVLRSPVKQAVASSMVSKISGSNPSTTNLAMGSTTNLNANIELAPSSVTAPPAAAWQQPAIVRSLSTTGVEQAVL